MKLLFSTNTNKDLAKKIIKKTNLTNGRVDIGRFSDGEIKVFLKEDVNGKKVFVLGSTFAPADNLVELLILINTLKVNGAKKVIAIIPYFAYAKADHIDPPGVCLSAKLMADLIKKSGASKVVVINLHSKKTEKFLGSTLKHLDAIPLLADNFSKENIDNLIVVSPDIGGIKRAKKFAKTINIKDIAYIKKYRPKLEKTASRGIVGQVKDKNVIIVDDMIQSGGTIIQAVNELKKAGAKNIYLSIVHLVKSGHGVEKLIKEKRIKKIYYTNTITIDKKLPKKFIEVDISDLIIFFMK